MASRRRLLPLALALLVVPSTAQAAFPGANGRILFHTTRDGNTEIYSMNAFGTGQANLTNHPASDADAQYSPDGSRIVFSSTRDGNSEVYVMDADGSNPLNLTNNAGADARPTFSPDGTRVIFQSTRDGNSEIYAMRPDGTNQVNLTNAASNELGPVVLQDGRIVFESTRDGNSEVYVMNADGSNQTRLTNNPAQDSAPATSPDGTKIAFNTNRDGNFEIYVMNTDGSGQTRLTTNGAEESQPAFSPDGTQIAMNSNRDGNFEVYTMNADGSGQTNRTNNAGFDAGSDWQPKPTAALAVTQTDSPDPVTKASQLTYTITVRNTGAHPAVGTNMSDTLPAEMTLVSATPSQGSCTGTTTVTCALGNVAPGATATVTIVTTATTAGTFSNNAVATSSSSEALLSDNAAAVATTVNDPPAPPLPPQPSAPVLTLTSSVAAIDFGESATLSGTVRRDGAPMATQEVSLLQGVPGETLSAFATTTSDVNGAFSQGVAPALTTRYRASVAGGANEPTVTVAVRPVVTLSARRKGRQAVLTGSLAPTLADETVEVQRLEDGKWTPFAAATTSSTSAFTVSKRVGRCGQHIFRAVDPATARHDRAVSEPALLEPHRVGLKVGRRGRVLTFSGRVRPKHRTGTVVIERKEGDGFARFAAAPVNRKSKFRVARRARKGSYEFRARFEADACHFGGASAPRVVAVP